MLFPILMFSFFFFNSSHAHSINNNFNIPRKNLCSNTPFPEFCNFNILKDNNNAVASISIHDYFKLSLDKSLSMTSNFLHLVNHYFTHHHNFHALEDCHILSIWNQDFINRTIEFIDSFTNSLPYLQLAYIQTLFSATLTNLQICFRWPSRNSSFYISKSSYFSFSQWMHAFL